MYRLMQITTRKLSKDRAMSDSRLSSAPLIAITDAPSELTPAIPAMFSKARGLLKRLKPSEEEQGAPECLPQSTTPSDDAFDSQTEVLIQCPRKVEELKTVSAEVRYKVITYDVMRTK